MAVFNDFELTNLGINLLGQVSAGQPLIFTKVELGDGDFTGDVKSLTGLFSIFKEASISDVVIQEDNSINIKSEFSNDGFLISKEWKEIGIFAKAGETGTEVLYSYSYSLLAVETIPAETIPYRRDLNFRNYISDVTNVTYDITIQKDKYDFDSDVAMKSATYLVVGDRVNVWKADSCQKRRVAVANNNGILLNNGLYANLILDIQGKYNSSITLTNKTVVGAINELNEIKEPSFTKNSGFNKVMVDVPEDDSEKVLSAKGGKYLEDKIITRNSEILYEGITTGAGLITLSESFDNFEKIGFEITNGTNLSLLIDIRWEYLYSDYIRTNDTATTADNQANDYAFVNWTAGLSSIYFRDDKLNIYMNDRTKISRIVGFNRI